jgi:O-antigen/teichoic acid export membrane protein
MTGTTIAQAIPIAISPILTRIYTPEDFGVFALFVAIVSTFGSIVNAKYELAIMLPKKDEDAINIVALSFILTIVISSILLILVLLLHNYFIDILDNKNIGIYLYLMPVSVFFIGIYNILYYFNNRKKYYKDIANSTILKSIITAIIQLSLGFFNQGVIGLISGQLISTVSANMKLLKNITKDKLLLSNIKKVKMIALAKKYKDFPKFTLWGGLANTLSASVTHILIATFFNVSTLGFYSFVQRLLGVPSSLIGSAIGQVFFQEATEEKRKTGKAVNSFNSTIKKLILIGLPSFIILYFIVEDLFAFVFGEKWRIAGVYAEIMMPLYFIRFIVSPLTIMNQVNLKNKLGMQWQFGLLILYVSVLYLANVLNLLFLDTLKIIVLIISSYYLYFLYLINQHVKEKDE